MLLELLSACSAFRAAPGTARAVVPLRAPLPLMASWTAADMKSKRLKLPEEVRTPHQTTALADRPPPLRLAPFLFRRGRWLLTAKSRRPQ